MTVRISQVSFIGSPFRVYRREIKIFVRQKHLLTYNILNFGELRNSKMDRLPFRCVLLLSLCVLLAAAPIVWSAEANEDVYIRADGSVEGTDKIQRDGNVYIFTGNISGSIVVEKDDVLVDGAGYGLQGTGIGAGINLTGRTGVTVRNMEISNFFYGIYLDSSLSNSLSSNNVRENLYGICLSESSSNSILGCNITENESSGVWLRCSSNNDINENRVTENGQDGIWLSCSSDNNRVLGNTIRTNAYGIRIDDYSNNMLRNNELTDNVCNLSVFGSLLPEFIQDIDESNTVNGKPVYYWINLQDATVPFDAGYVALVNCSGITVQNLNLRNNGQGLLLASTAESSITQNSITANIHGVYMCGSSNNTVAGNNITKNLANGIYLYYSQNNKFFHNNFIDNTTPVYDVGDPSNIWDNGTEGNHWNNYNGTDTDGDGIGDTPHVLDGNNQDNHPIVNTIPEFPSWTILPLLLMATIFLVAAKKRIYSKLYNR
jgi:parallel beta-helix repeat protein